MNRTIESRPAAISESTRAECVRLLFRLSNATVAASLSIALLTVAWLWNDGTRNFLGAWLAGLLAMGLATFAMRRRVLRVELTSASADRWEQVFALLCACHGLAWGALGFLDLASATLPYQVVLVLMLGVVALVATGALAASRIAFYSFVFSAIGPFATHLIIDRASVLPYAGWALLAYLLLLLALHELFHRNLLVTIDKRFQSDELAREQQVIFDAAAEGIAFLRGNTLVKCNRRFADMLGFEVGEMIGQPAWTWQPSYEEWKLIADDCQAVVAAGQTYRHVARFRRKDGSLFWGEISGKAVDPRSLGLGVVWLGRDITEQLATESALKASEGRFRDLVALSTDWYWEQDRELRFTRTSGGVLARAGHDDSGIIGKRRWELTAVTGVSAEQWRAHREQLDRRLPFRDFLYQIALPDGALRWVSVSGNPLFDESGEFRGYHGVGSDITERVESAEQMRHLAHHDALTGLPNRRLFTDRVENALAIARRSGRHVSLMLLDLDDFKIVNDEHGHSTGDDLLVAVAQRIKGAVREGDTVARLGGDEFVVLLPDLAAPRDAVRVAEKIIESLRDPVAIGARSFAVGASIGIALFPDHGDSPERLLQYADVAMYEAKGVGGSAYQFSGAGTLADAEPAPPQDATRH
jgi:diguanylate cyclase (GGDEF)-like protein/PAS domain S-box-containing protein